MKTAFLSDIGRKRTSNQDYVNTFTNQRDITLAIVADGMGGHKGGDVASDMAVSHIGHDFEKTDLGDLSTIKEWITSELEKENSRIIEASQQFSDLNGMGTTMVSAIIIDNQVLVSNVGDSRCYLLRDGELKQLSFDHSLVNELVRSGELTKEEARNHPQKNIITQTLGVNSNVKSESNIFDLAEDDVLLLCSDGLTNMVSEDMIKEILLENVTLKEQCKKLIQKANNAGGLDNITALIIKNNVSEDK
ncbi:Stp1/IreP family PP2C-type Ser/Thr phosphatase [Lactobacillus sp. YT155]|uniref:Stp1/IreP family PP2C-type Ser/Thr phosphatase n=1 Tax=Lactobacillus sp. YT155 TaxID=3060955 RepID=UPI00265E1A3F|nr:Stp1/IreP family PP2C-type Ser/Thr phosphatase [Lactobacillus sp. YT155]MDO1605546.1 Stp1/IreP family PP2C-type Ser/Thr phosphatase [Lactobacillus sp. YT155]